MSNIQLKAAQGGIGNADDSGSTGEHLPASSSPRQDFGFAVKLFGIAGLVILVIWLMNRAVS